jgi:hypothetical protein
MGTAQLLAVAGPLVQTNVIAGAGFQISEPPLSRSELSCGVTEQPPGLPHPAGSDRRATSTIVGTELGPCLKRPSAFDPERTLD